MNSAVSDSRSEPVELARRLRRDVESAADDLEVLRGRLAGTHRVLDEATTHLPVQVDYQRWERGLQGLEAAYRCAADVLGDLATSAEWRWISRLRDDLGDLGRHMTATATRHSATWDWSPDLRGAAAAAAISDVALQLAARLGAEAAMPAAGLASLARTADQLATTLAQADVAPDRQARTSAAASAPAANTPRRPTSVTTPTRPARVPPPPPAAPVRPPAPVRR